MKYLITISLALLLTALLSLPAGAIDKKRDPSPKEDTPTVEKKAPERPQSVNDSKATEIKPSRKSYDDFVDRNNNGIDDRAEKGSAPKKPKTPETRKKTPEKPKP